MENKKLKQAFILAAGFGTRLKPLTNNIPKALVKINNIPMLEILIKKLINYGINKIVINTHHFANKIEDFVNKSNFNADIVISNETEILDTGGGIVNAKRFFDLQNHILIHNVDIISNIDLQEFYNFHLKSQAIASLFVQNRKTSRYLLFDKNNQLSGWINKKTNEKIIYTEKSFYKEFAFNGIHIISPKIFNYLKKYGKFSIIPEYLKIAEKHKILAFENKKYYWQDAGKINVIKQIEKDFYKLNT